VRVDEWDSFESRVTANTKKILEVLAEHDTKATFFVVGWTAEQFPDLVKEIVEAGHVIGCHSYLHRKIYTMTPDEFREDTSKAKTILEDISGKPVLGYRAPSYSITKHSLWALDILGELGFTYDSSIFPIMHDNYGIPDAPRFSYQHPGMNMIEYPISTAVLMGRKIPVSGGGYFRLFPYWFTRLASGRSTARSISHSSFISIRGKLTPASRDSRMPRGYRGSVTIIISMTPKNGSGGCCKILFLHLYR